MHKVVPEFEALKKVLDSGQLAEIESAIQACISAGMSAEEIVTSLQDYTTGVGQQFEKGRIFLPQMIVVAMGIESALVILKPHFDNEPDMNIKGHAVVMGTVQGDVHDIGKNICTMLFTIAGFDVCDLGRDVPVEKFVDEVKAGVSYCGMSSLMTTSMMSLKDIIDELEEEGIRNTTVVMVGGAPVTQAFADKIGADIYGETAFDTLSKVRKDIDSKCKDD